MEKIGSKQITQLEPWAYFWDLFYTVVIKHGAQESIDMLFKKNPMKANLAAPNYIMARLDWHGATIEYCQSWTSPTSGEFRAEAITTLWLHHAGTRVVFTFWALFQYEGRVSSYGDYHLY